MKRVTIVMDEDAFKRIEGARFLVRESQQEFYTKGMTVYLDSRKKELKEAHKRMGGMFE